MVKRTCDICGKEMELSGYMGLLIPPFNENKNIPKILMNHNGIIIDLCEDCENKLIEFMQGMETFMKGLETPNGRITEIFNDESEGTNGE